MANPSNIPCSWPRKPQSSGKGAKVGSIFWTYGISRRIEYLGTTMNPPDCQVPYIRVQATTGLWGRYLLPHTAHRWLLWWSGITELLVQGRAVDFDKVIATDLRRVWTVGSNRHHLHTYFFRLLGRSHFFFLFAMQRKVKNLVTPFSTCD